MLSTASARCRSKVIKRVCRSSGIGKVPDFIGGIDDGQKVLPSEFCPPAAAVCPTSSGVRTLKLALFMGGSAFVLSFLCDQRHAFNDRVQAPFLQVHTGNGLVSLFIAVS